jgi:hypothetical protein
MSIAGIMPNDIPVKRINLGDSLPNIAQIFAHIAVSVKKIALFPTPKLHRPCLWRIPAIE